MTSNQIVPCQCCCQNLNGGNNVNMSELFEYLTRTMTIDAFEATVKRWNLNVASGGRCGWTPLAVAAKEGNVELTRHIILKYGVQLINLGNQRGVTAVHAAAALEDEDVSLSLMELFRSFGPSAMHTNILPEQSNDIDAINGTPLEIARARKHSRVATYLVERCGGLAREQAAGAAADDKEQQTKKKRKAADNETK